MQKSGPERRQLLLSTAGLGLLALGSGASMLLHATDSTAQNKAVAQRIRILCLGDSMTSGAEDNPIGFRAYRGRLQQLLGAAGIDADFIGSNQLLPAIGGDPDHDGYGGAFIGPGGNSHNLWDRLPKILSAQVNPDVIIMAFGWNSVYNEPAVAAKKYQDIVNQVALMKPKAKLLLATLSPQRGETQAQTNKALQSFSELNQIARSMASASANDNLYVADLAAGSYVPADYWDVIHWSQSGADKAAKIIYDALMAGPLKR